MPRLLTLGCLVLSLLAADAAHAGDEADRVVAAARQMVGACQYQDASLDNKSGSFTRIDANQLGAWARGERAALPQAVNCWDMIYLAAAKANVISPQQIGAVQDKASRSAARQYRRDLEESGPKYRINLQISAMFTRNEKVVGPLGYYQATPYRRASDVPADAVRAGDVIFFGHSAPHHAALALGSRNTRGEHEVLSIDIDAKAIERTTIQALAERMRGERAPSVPVRVGRPQWAKLARRAQRWHHRARSGSTKQARAFRSLRGRELVLSPR